jgi:hypothetical protein
MIVFKSRHDVLVRTTDGRNFVVAENIDLVDEKGTTYRVPVGAQSDGCSIPPELWGTKLTPFGPWWRSAVVHDAGYRNTLLRLRADGTWDNADLSKDQCDHLFLDCMLCDGVDLLIREAIYEGVHIAGWKAFREDRG